MDEKISQFLSLFNVKCEEDYFKSTVDSKSVKGFDDNIYLILDGKYIRGRFKKIYIQLYSDEELSYATVINRNTIYKFISHVIDEHQSAEEIDISKTNSTESVTFKLYFDDRNYKEILSIEIYDSNECIAFIAISSITALITYIEKNRANARNTLLTSNEPDNIIKIIATILEKNLGVRNSTLMNPTLKLIEQLRYLIETAMEKASENTETYIAQIEEEKAEFISRKNEEIQIILKKQNDFLKREKPKKSDKK